MYFNRKKQQNKNCRYKFQGLLEQTSGDVVRTVYGFWNVIMLLIVSKQPAGLSIVKRLAGSRGAEVML